MEESRPCEIASYVVRKEKEQKRNCRGICICLSGPLGLVVVIMTVLTESSRMGAFSIVVSEGWRGMRIIGGARVLRRSDRRWHGRRGNELGPNRRVLSH